MSGYKQFHGLSGPLFGKGLGPGALLVYPQLQELEDELEVLVEEGGVGVLSGEMGMGKTTALRHYIDQRSDRNVQALYHGSSRHSTALLEALAEGLGVAPARHRAALLRQVGQQVERTWHELSRDTHFPALRGHLLSRRALELVAASGAGRDPLLDLLHPETAAIDLDDVAVVQQTVEDCGRQDLVPGQHVRPVPDPLIGGDHRAAPLVAVADHLEQEVGISSVQGLETQLVDHQHGRIHVLPAA